MYRLLAAEHGRVRERRDQLEHPAYAKPGAARRAARTRSTRWDITKLLGPAKWTYFYLYVILDVFSRYVVGWMVQHRESGQVAKELIAQICEQQQITAGQLTMHADRGSSMTSSPSRSCSPTSASPRPTPGPTSPTTTPTREAQFKTLKYRPAFPRRFGSIEHARAFCRDFFDWYNHEHRHSGIGLLTPATVHHGHAERTHAERARSSPPPTRARPSASSAARPHRRRPDRGLDQQAQHRPGRSLNPNADRLIRLDRFRPEAT